MEQNISVQDVALAVICLLVFLDNLVVVLAFIKTSQIHTPTNLFIAGMASADALFGLYLLPQSLFMKYGQEYISSFKNCLTICCLTAYVIHISMYMVLGFTLNRFFLLRFPVQYERYVTNKRAMIAVVCIWVITVPLDALPLMGVMKDDNQKGNYDGICRPESVFSKQYAIYYFCGITLSITAVLLVVNIYALHLVRRYRHGSDITAAEHLDLRAETYLMVIISSFLVFTMPINILNFVSYYNNTVANWELYTVLKCIYMCNSFFNPLIYAWGTKDLRKPIVDILLCRRPYEFSNQTSQPCHVVPQNCNTDVVETSVTADGAAEYRKNALRIEMSRTLPKNETKEHDLDPDDNS